MISIRVHAIGTNLIEEVRTEKQDPRYGFPAYTAILAEPAPCRHCLRRIAPGQPAMLFTYDCFEGQESLPLPGPVYIHADGCERYPEDAGFPAELRDYRTLNAYGRGRRLVAQEYVHDGSDVEEKLEGSSQGKTSTTCTFAVRTPAVTPSGSSAATEPQSLMPANRGERRERGPRPGWTWRPGTRRWFCSWRGGRAGVPWLPPSIAGSGLCAEPRYGSTRRAAARVRPFACRSG
jgi:hypothetical protein